jgi:prepilin-type N-terminal cleavage/methylation domain-containing protein
MHKYSFSSVRGFTLIELLTVIGIIGILAAILIPTLGRVRATAQRAVDASNLREIGKAALLYAADNNDRLPDPAGPAGATITAPNPYFAYLGLLARDSGLNEATLYFSKNDAQFDGVVPLGILNPADPTKSSLHPDLLTRVPGVNLVGGIKLTDPATTPIAFTRGLLASGTWNGTANNGNQGAYADAGGHVLFLGGNVQYFRSVAGRLVDSQGNPTADLRATIKANGIASETGGPATGL